MVSQMPMLHRNFNFDDTLDSGLPYNYGSYEPNAAALDVTDAEFVYSSSSGELCRNNLNNWRFTYCAPTTTESDGYSSKSAMDKTHRLGLRPKESNPPTATDYHEFLNGEYLMRLVAQHG